ncbi:hypothetical protein LZ009_05880 [Ramlibacter sp. XY19]|uniref:hypothetical protein n=1 Tax=Ramlibacter paludis TaxID=2908000 RepID=UPI0023DA59C4|nr:hypothetical protein [Ramlibacter paludis]MCG2592307.1 hypothetical protein [Ramlibacter paludis]
MRFFLLLLPVIAGAQPVPGGFALGMNATQLQQADPALKRVPHPARLSGGLAGIWSGGDVRLGEVALTPTFFLAEGELRRVEYLAHDGLAATYAALLAWARGMWGAELASNAPEGAYASWDTPELQAYLQRTVTPRGEQVRLVTRKRALKDAGEL